MQFKTKLIIAQSFIGLVALGFLAIIVVGIFNDWQKFLDFMIAIGTLSLFAGFIAMMFWSAKIIEEGNRRSTEKYIKKYGEGE